MHDTIAWFDGGFDAALAAAHSAGRSLFLYWGAGWCPPCNRVKAEIFSREEFAGMLQSMVAVQLDGDAPGAQALAQRLRLRSYPTLVVLRPDGSEITRLPCELDGERFGEALMAARFAAHGAGASLAAALDGARPLAPAEWTLLAYYSWDTDEGVLLQGRALAAVLGRLAGLADAAVAGEAPAAARQIQDAAARLHLHALLAPGAVADAAMPERLLALCADARQARANIDLFVNAGHLLVRAAPARHAELATALALLARGWAEDMWLSPADRLLALRLQVRMARLGDAVEGLPLLLRTRVEQALALTDDPYARHTLLNTAYSALNDAGLPGEAEALLQGALATSHSPYYFMLSLASAAKRRGDLPGMLDWYEQAWRGAVGPATRIQWGVTYLAALIDTTPADGARLAAAAAGVARDFAAAPDAFAQRNLSQVRKLQGKLAALPEQGPELAALAVSLAAAG